MWSRRILIACIGLAAGVFDACVVSWFAGAWGAVRVSLPLVILLAAFSSRERALTAAVASGFALDLLLPSFGLITLRYMLVAVSMHAIAERYVTNRTFQGSLALGVVGAASDGLLRILVTLLRGMVQTPFIPETHTPLWADMLWTAGVVGAAFLVFAAFGKRFLPLVTRR